MAYPQRQADGVRSGMVETIGDRGGRDAGDTRAGGTLKGIVMMCPGVEWLRGRELGADGFSCPARLLAPPLEMSANYFRPRSQGHPLSRQFARLRAPA